MLRAAEQDRPDVAVRRRLWRSWQPFMDPERFVFIDETGASTNMIRRYGWAPRSERLIAAAPHGHWRTTTFVAGLRSTGLVAPLVPVGRDVIAGTGGMLLGYARVSKGDEQNNALQARALRAA